MWIITSSFCLEMTIEWNKAEISGGKILWLLRVLLLAYFAWSQNHYCGSLGKSIAEDAIQLANVILKKSLCIVLDYWMVVWSFTAASPQNGDSFLKEIGSFVGRPKCASRHVSFVLGYVYL